MCNNLVNMEKLGTKYSLPNAPSDIFNFLFQGELQIPHTHLNTISLSFVTVISFESHQRTYDTTQATTLWYNCDDFIYRYIFSFCVIYIKLWLGQLFPKGDIREFAYYNIVFSSLCRPI